MFRLEKYIPIGLALMIILIILAGYFFVFPKYQDYVPKKEELDAKDVEIAAKEKYLPKLEVATKRLLEYSSQISIIESALSLEPSIAALSNYFQKTISQNGLVLKDLDVSQLFINNESESSGEKSESSGNVRNMLFSASVAGSYESFKTFLLDVYLNARIIEIESFSLSYAQGEGEDGELIPNDLLDYKINLRTHSYNIFINPIKNSIE